MRNLLIIILAFAGLFSCAKPEGFVIKGQIKGKESGEIKLMKYADGKWITEDSAKIEKGKFELKGKTELPELRMISMEPQTVVAQFFAENARLTVNADVDSLNNTEVKGSKSNDEFLILTKELKNIPKGKFKITRLGMGIPTGADLEYADEITLQRAMEGRDIYG